MFRLGDDQEEIMESFIFLGSKVEVSGECRGEMNRRLTLGRTAMSGFTKILKSLEKSTILGRVEGTRGRGRCCACQIDGVNAATKLSLPEPQINLITNGYDLVTT